jgi:hypothetical protein
VNLNLPLRICLAGRSAEKRSEKARWLFVCFSVPGMLDHTVFTKPEKNTLRWAYATTVTLQLAVRSQQLQARRARTKIAGPW